MDFYYWIEIALYAGVVQGIFLSLFLPKLSKVNKEANKILAILLLLASAGTFLFLNSVYLSRWWSHMQVFLDTIPFLFAPLLFLYIRKLLFFHPVTKRAAFHFVPAMLHLIYGLSSLRFSEDEYAKMAIEGSLRWEWMVIFGILCIWIFSYWIYSVRLLIKFRKEKEEVLSFQHNLQYLSIFLGAVLFCYLLGIIFSLDFFFGIKLFSFTGFNLGWIVLPLLIYSVSYFVFIQPDAMRVSMPENRKPLSRLSEVAIEQNKAKLEQVMQHEKLYLNPLLKLNGVAERLPLDVTKLSWLINEGYGCNFYDFVNHYRIEAFIEKLNSNEHKSQTLLALAYEVGFNSKTTFNKSFKNKLGLTPSAYVKNLNTREKFSATTRLAG